MQKQVMGIVQDHRAFDNGVNMEDVQTVELPNMEFATTEMNGSGMAGAVNMPDYSSLNAMSMSMNHNNGLNCHRLRRPGKHELEFRAAVQVLDVVSSEPKVVVDKFRVVGLFTGNTGGSLERSNPRGSTDTFSVLRYEEERDGEILTLIDIPKGKIMIDGVDYAAKTRGLLD